MQFTIIASTYIDLGQYIQTAYRIHADNERDAIEAADEYGEVLFVFEGFPICLSHDSKAIRSFDVRKNRLADQALSASAESLDQGNHHV